MAALTEAFSEASCPCMGMEMVPVQFSSDSRETPLSSDPTTMAVGAAKSASVQSVSTTSVTFAGSGVVIYGVWTGASER